MGNRLEREKRVSETTSDPKNTETIGNAPGQAAAGVDEGSLDPQTARSLQFVRTLVQHMQMDAEVILAPDDGEGSEDEIRLEIEGPDAGRIIGKRGAVLEAIQ